MSKISKYLQPETEQNPEKGVVFVVRQSLKAKFKNRLFSALTVPSLSMVDQVK